MTPHLGPRCRPGCSSPVTPQTDRNATQYEDLPWPWGMQHNSERYLHMLMTALHHTTTVPTLPSSPVRTTSNSAPAVGCDTPLPRHSSVCVHLQHLHIPELLLTTVGVGWKAGPAPGHVSRRQHRYRRILFLGPPSGPLPRMVSLPPAAPALHCTPAALIRVAQVTGDHSVMCTE